MLIHILLFAGARQRTGRDALALDVPAGTTVGELRSILAAAHPALASLLPHARFAVNSEYASEDTVLPATGEIAVIPPVSGG